MVGELEGKSRRSNSQLVAKIVSVALNMLLSLASMNCNTRQCNPRHCKKEEDGSLEERSMVKKTEGGSLYIAFSYVFPV